MTWPPIIGRKVNIHQKHRDPDCVYLFSTSDLTNRTRQIPITNLIKRQTGSPSRSRLCVAKQFVWPLCISSSLSKSSIKLTRCTIWKGSGEWWWRFWQSIELNSDEVLSAKKHFHRNIKQLVIADIFSPEKCLWPVGVHHEKNIEDKIKYAWDYKLI